MQCNQLCIRNRIPASVLPLKQRANAIVTQIVEAQILDTQHVAGPGEVLAYGFGVIGEYQIPGIRHGFDYLPSLFSELEPPVIAFLRAWVLEIADHAGLLLVVIV